MKVVVHRGRGVDVGRYGMRRLGSVIMPVQVGRSATVAVHVDVAGKRRRLTAQGRVERVILRRPFLIWHLFAIMPMPVFVAAPALGV